VVDITVGSDVMLCSLVATFSGNFGGFLSNRHPE